MGKTATLEFQAIWRILVFGLILGAGLPAIFALGIRSLAFGQGGEAEEHATGTAPAAPNPVGVFGAYVLFALVLVAVALGLLYLVVTGQGKVLDFSHVYPIIADKKH